MCLFHKGGLCRQPVRPKHRLPLGWAKPWPIHKQEPAPRAGTKVHGHPKEVFFPVRKPVSNQARGSCILKPGPKREVRLVGGLVIVVATEVKGSVDQEVIQRKQRALRRENNKKDFRRAPKHLVE